MCPRQGYFFIIGKDMIIEPSVKRVCAFFDGQNLFHAAKEAFGSAFQNGNMTDALILTDYR